MVPVPSILASQIYPAFQKQAKESNMDERHSLPDSPHSPFMAITVGSSPAIFLTPKASNLLDHEMTFDGFNKKRNVFNIQMPRQVMAILIGTPDRDDWRACVVSEEEETERTEGLREVYKFE